MILSVIEIVSIYESLPQIIRHEGMELGWQKNKLQKPKQVRRRMVRRARNDLVVLLMCKGSCIFIVQAAFAITGE
jgi:hypothetical protein